MYTGLSGQTVKTNQFSASSRITTMDLSTGHIHALPGVFFVYEFSPFMIRMYDERPPLVHFITGVCAIIGGAVTVSGIVDALAHHLSKAAKSLPPGFQ